MFYAHFVLSKKGPLARIWLAAHWDKKLTKAHVFETNIEGSVEAIIQPKVKLALRTSGHLLLGVVRIYSRKAKYLLADCNEAFVKIKMAFRPGVVDLPEENREAAVATITLPETFHDFDTTMADLNDIDVPAQFSVNQSRPEEITMREDLGNITLVGDDGFGDMGFESGANIIQDAHMDDTLYVKNPDSSSLLLPDPTAESQKDTDKPMDIDFHAQPRHDDGFGDGMGDFEGPAGCDDDDDDDDNDDNFGGDVDHELFGENFVGEAGGLFEEPPVPEVLPAANDTSVHKEDGKVADIFSPAEDTAAPLQEQTTMPDQTTLITNEAEAFALEPIDVTSIGTERKSKRKRKLVIDDQKGIASETMKVQLSDTSDIVSTLDLAPPTKKLMHWKETGGVEKLFALSGRPMVSKRMSRMFTRNLITRPMKDDEAEQEATLDLEQERAAAAPITASVVAEESMSRPERARDTTNTFEEEAAIPIELPSMADEPSHIEPEQPSIMEKSHIIGIDESLAMPPPVEEAEEPPLLQPQSMMSRPDVSSEEEDIDDIFNDMPPEPDQDSNEGPESGEAAEEQEERRWNKRTQQMLHILTRHMPEPTDTTGFKSLVARNNRKQVASKFATFLVLKKMQAVEVRQDEPYGDITISRGPRFEVVY